MRQLDVNDVKSLLHAMLDGLLGQSKETLSAMAEEPVVCPDATDRATVETDRQMALLMRERDRRLIDEIHAALDRVQDGEYGICQECGEEIGAARLRAQPTATLCVHCKSLLETVGRGAMIPRVHELAFAE